MVLATLTGMLAILLIIEMAGVILFRNSALLMQRKNPSVPTLLYSRTKLDKEILEQVRACF